MVMLKMLVVSWLVAMMAAAEMVAAIARNLSKRAQALEDLAMVGVMVMVNREVNLREEIEGAFKKRI